MKKTLLLLLAAIPYYFTATSQQLTAVSVNLFAYLPDFNNERSLRDGVAVIFNGQSDDVDLADAKKMANPAENIAILRNRILLAGEQRTSFDTIPITLWNLQQRNYELEIFTRNINTIFLEEVNTHRILTIAASDTLRYSFSNQTANTPLDSSTRFWLIFDTTHVITPPHPCGHHPHHHGHHRNEHKNIRLYPNPVIGSYINLDMKHLCAGRYKVTILGLNHASAYMFTHTINCTERINTSHLPKGKYYFILEDEEGWRTTKQIEVN
ncbi:MAG: hypothetical protein IPP72_15940 [Chitinophagaceae bacterium]|nr:hypothetical protein [Chitinophagaceae bacterium]